MVGVQTAQLEECIASAVGGGSAAQALESLPVAILTIDASGFVAAGNAAARVLLAPLSPAGFRLGALLDLAGASGGLEVIASLQGDGSDAPVRVNLADGRKLECHASRLPDGGAVMALLDVTSHIRGAALAARDPLTGLINRGGLHERLLELLDTARRNQTALAVLCLDLDRFKSVNDSLGHPIGDELLAKVAERLRKSSRAGDVVARLGGDEFAVIQTEAAQPDGAQALAARIVDMLGRPYVVQGHMVTVGASVGISLAPADSTDPATLLKNADLALYRSKAEGRGAFRFFQPGMDAEMQQRRALEIEIRAALAHKQFELAYQPQVKLETNTLAGFEALLRWRHPSRGLVPPGDFLPLAEEIGLIDQIGDWVLRTACRDAASWAQPVSIAVNISPIQFRYARLVAAVKSALAASRLDPRRLELEITEGALLNHTEIVLDALNELKALGVRISMDDFGTGYSSLSHLQKFPFDKVKIDQSFVRAADSKAEGAAIVRAIAALGSSLGRKTTAEGVETSEQMERMRAAGCTEVQGFFTGRPLPAAAAAALLRPPPNDAGKPL